MVVRAPVRIADIGGWTDTWFARSGAVCSIGVGPTVTVTAVFDDGPLTRQPVRLVAPDLGEDYRCGPGPTTGWDEPRPGRHPIIEHVIADVCTRFPPSRPVTVTVTSTVAPGASLGTSASVMVALLAALERLSGTGNASARTVAFTDAERRRYAEAAHRIETVAAGREAGVQDPFAAAYGGVQLLKITDYPTTERRIVAITDDFRSALEERLVTVVTGPHDSSAVHAEVIASVTASGRTGERRRGTLAELATLAEAAADALATSDLGAWADVLVQSTRAQLGLHAGLVGPGHRTLIEAARAHHALGWKVNGAGGAGGSLSVVFRTPEATDEFAATIIRRHPAWSIHRLPISSGITVADADDGPSVRE